MAIFDCDWRNYLSTLLCSTSTIALRSCVMNDNLINGRMTNSCRIYFEQNMNHSTQNQSTRISEMTVEISRLQRDFTHLHISHGNRSHAKVFTAYCLIVTCTLAAIKKTSSSQRTRAAQVRLLRYYDYYNAPNDERCLYTHWRTGHKLNGPQPASKHMF